MRLSTRLLRWYSRHGRALPWRETRDPFAVLLSEVMLQQTQVARVLPAYRRFLSRFPTLAHLARASLGDVLREWSGLGYNRRARDLHLIARAHPAGLPRSVERLDALNGVGAYTAGAVACFAFGARVAFADTNIRRVLGRVFLGRVATAREAVELDRAHMPRGRVDRWHHALMDVGARYCRTATTRCGECPLRPVCRARGPGPSDRSRRAPERYATSDRRVRGGVLRELAVSTRPLGAAQLTRRVGDTRAPALAERLVAEGLVARAGARFRLPP
jgi:A/G-specific adenine glycosylase